MKMCVALAIMIVFIRSNKSSEVKGVIPDCKAKKEILDSHNNYRKAEGAADMKKMVWRDTLAEVARNYSALCQWKHGNLEPPKLWYGPVGQNLYTSKGVALRFSSVVTSWFEEKKDYTFDTKFCVPGRLCGHYTQVVWANTSDVGCAYTDCDELQMPNKESLSGYRFVVCYYGPTGNYDSLPLYKKGESCTGCPEGFEDCEDGMCDSGDGYGDIDLMDKLCSSNGLAKSPTLFLIMTMAVSTIFVLVN